MLLPRLTAVKAGLRVGRAPTPAGRKRLALLIESSYPGFAVNREGLEVLTSGTRLRLLHALARNADLCVTDLANAVRMKPQAVSNQLQRLVAWGVLEAHADGNFVHYRIVDPCITKLLDSGLCLMEDAERSEAGQRG